MMESEVKTPSYRDKLDTYFPQENELYRIITSYLESAELSRELKDEGLTWEMVEPYLSSVVKTLKAEQFIMKMLKKLRERLQTS